MRPDATIIKYSIDRVGSRLDVDDMAGLSRYLGRTGGIATEAPKNSSGYSRDRRQHFMASQLRLRG